MQELIVKAYVECVPETDWQKLPPDKYLTLPPVELYVYSYQYNVTILGSFLGLLKSVQAFF